MENGKYTAEEINNIMENIFEDGNLCIMRNALEQYNEIKEQTKQFLVIDGSSNVYVEAKNKNGDMKEYCDCVLVGDVQAANEEEAEKKFIKEYECADRILENLSFYEIKPRI